MLESGVKHLLRGEQRFASTNMAPKLLLDLSRVNRLAKPIPLVPPVTTTRLPWYLLITRPLFRP
jgi:hypothetical protein